METAHIIFEGKSLVLYYNKSSNLFSQYFPLSSSSRDDISYVYKYFRQGLEVSFIFLNENLDRGLLRG